MDNDRLAVALQKADMLCRERGARLTPQRRQVLEILCAAERPLGAYEILAGMRKGVRAPAPPTVYRALDFLLSQGLAHKLESLNAFVGCARPGSLHSGQFLICAQCGQVTELEDSAIAESLKLAARESGFEPDRRIVELIGTCAACANGDLEVVR